MIRVWDVRDESLRRGVGAPASFKVRQLGGSFELGNLIFTPDGARLALFDADHPIHVLDISLLPGIPAISECLAMRPSEAGGINSMLFSPDGSFLAIGVDKGDQRGEVRLWRAAPEAEVRRSFGLDAGR